MQDAIDSQPPYTPAPFDHKKLRTMAEAYADGSMRRREEQAFGELARLGAKVIEVQAIELAALKAEREANVAELVEAIKAAPASSPCGCKMVIGSDDHASECILPRGHAAHSNGSDEWVDDIAQEMAQAAGLGEYWEDGADILPMLREMRERLNAFEQMAAASRREAAPASAAECFMIDAYRLIGSNLVAPPSEVILRLQHIIDELNEYRIAKAESEVVPTPENLAAVAKGCVWCKTPGPALCDGCMNRYREGAAAYAVRRSSEIADAKTKRPTAKEVMASLDAMAPALTTTHPRPGEAGNRRRTPQKGEQWALGYGTSLQTTCTVTGERSARFDWILRDEKGRFFPWENGKPWRFVAPSPAPALDALGGGSSKLPSTTDLHALLERCEGGSVQHEIVMALEQVVVRLGEAAR